MPFSRTLERAGAGSVVSAYMRQVYQWMTLGLALTTVVSWAVATSPAAQAFIFGNTLVMILLVAAQFGLVIALSAAVHKMSAGTATGLFLLDSALTGATRSSISLSAMFSRAAESGPSRTSQASARVHFPLRRSSIGTAAWSVPMSAGTQPAGTIRQIAVSRFDRLIS